MQIVGANSLDILKARDISTTGLSIYVPHRFEGCDIDSEVQLVITLPHQKTFLARGTIRHLTRKDEPSEYFGVEFTDIAAEHQAQLLSYLQDYLAR